MNIFTVDIICVRYFKDNIEVLLSKRDVKNRPFFGKYAITGGFIHTKDESKNYDKEDLNIVSAFQRIFKNKVFNDLSIIKYKEELAAVGSAHRDPDGWALTIPYIVILSPEKSLEINMENKKWVSIEDIVSGDFSLPFDHNQIIKQAYQCLVNKSQYSSIPLFFMEDEFKVSDVISFFDYIKCPTSKMSISNRFIKKDIMVLTGKKANSSAKGGKRPDLYSLSVKDIQYFNNTIG